MEEYKKIYYEANAFLQAANMLYSEENKLYGWFNPVLYPTIVNISFSCELFFKCLLAKDNKIKRTHNLKGLFDKLDDEKRKRIKELVNEDKFDEILEEQSNYFEKFRYIYENGKEISSVNLSFLFVLANSLKAVIKENI